MEKLTPAQQEVYDRFGPNLKLWIRTHFGTITEFCNQTGFKQPYVSKWITGFQAPRFPQVLSLHLVGFPLDWAMSNEGDAVPPLVIPAITGAKGRARNAASGAKKAAGKQSKPSTSRKKTKT